jgi:hypothetical protein
MKPPVINCCLLKHPSRVSGGVRLRPLGFSHPDQQVCVPSFVACHRSRYNQNAECKIRSKPTLGLPSIETACLRLAVTCCHVLTVTRAQTNSQNLITLEHVSRAEWRESQVAGTTTQSSRSQSTDANDLATSERGL